jgi:hypothetical protein
LRLSAGPSDHPPDSPHDSRSGGVPGKGGREWNQG